MRNMSVNTNVLALNSHRSLKKVSGQLFKASQRLSSGLRINSSADDAAGPVISEKMRSQIRSLQMASRIARDGILTVQTAEDALAEIGNITKRIRELTVQAANDTNQVADRTKIQNEIDQLLDKINAMATKAEFNKIKIINGEYASGAAALPAQFGANEEQVITLNIGTMNTAGLKIDAFSVDGLTDSEISAKISAADYAVNQVAGELSKLRAIHNRLEFLMRSLELSAENLYASESRIRDAGIAKEMMEFTRANVLPQAAASVLAQANRALQRI